MFEDKKHATKVCNLLRVLLSEDPEERPESVSEVIDYFGW
jgi:hypothetical protein